MASDDPAAAKTQARLVVRNIGLLLTGDLRRPILDADTVVAVDGKITAVGKEKDIDSEGATLVIDAKGTTLAPGLIDSHVHPVAGLDAPSEPDWLDRQLPARRSYHDDFRR
jgi:enamidase